MALRRLFPAMRIDYTRVPGREWMEDPDRRYVNSIEIRAPLLQAIRRAQSAIVDDLPKGFSLPEGSLQRTDEPLIPLKVLREAIVNAVMHRDYRQNSAIHIIRYANRIEVRNPGYSLAEEEPPKSENGTLDVEGESEQAERPSPQAEGESEQADGATPQAKNQKLPEELRELVSDLRDKADSEELRRVILRLCQWRPLSAAELSDYLQRGRRYLVHSHLNPMIEQEMLERTRPNAPRSPNQKYRVPSEENS